MSSRLDLVPVYDCADGQFRTNYIDTRFENAALISETELASLTGILPGNIREEVLRARRDEIILTDPLILPALPGDDSTKPLLYVTCDDALVLLARSRNGKGQTMVTGLAFIRARRVEVLRALIERNRAGLIGSVEQRNHQLKAENARLQEKVATTQQLVEGATRSQNLPPVTEWPESICLTVGEEGVVRYGCTETVLYLRFPRRLYHRDIPYTTQSFPWKGRRENHHEFPMHLKTELPLELILGSGAGSTIVLGFGFPADVRSAWTAHGESALDVLAEQGNFLARQLTAQDKERGQ